MVRNRVIPFNIRAGFEKLRCILAILAIAGAPIRAQQGIWLEMWESVVAAEGQVDDTRQETVFDSNVFLKSQTFVAMTNFGAKTWNMLHHNRWWYRCCCCEHRRIWCISLTT